MINLGIVKPGSTQRIPWGSYDGATGASEAASGFSDADILVYKDGSTTQVAGGSCGGTATTSFDSGDGLVGINLITLNLANNTTAGHWAAGSEYLIIVGAVTVDGQTVYFPAARLVIGQPNAVLNTTIATLATQTSFTLATGPAEDNALNGCKVYLHDVASAVQGSFAVVLDYTGSTKTVTLVTAPTFTIATTDNVAIFPPTDTATIVSGILAEVATAQELVDAIDNDSTVLENINIFTNEVYENFYGLVFARGVIGATGNDTTHLHIPFADLYANDAIVNTLLAIFDASTGISYSRWIDGWASTGDLVTVATLPFTPEASVDTVWLTGVRRDVTVAAIGAAGAGLTAITDRLSPLATKTGAVVTDGGNSSTVFKTDLTETTTDYWKDSYLKLTSGVLINQVKKITAYNGTTKVITVLSGFTGTPAAAVTFEIVND